MHIPSPIPPAPPDFRSGFIALVGRPNVGKSTLLNALVGQKIAITSPTAQTTRNRLQGILTLDRAQIILVDTPGIHKPHHLLGEVLVKNAIAAINAVDLVIWLVDSSVELGGGDRFVAELLQKTQVPTILGLNKIDQVQGEIDPSYQTYIDPLGWSAIPFSALTGQGIGQLQQQCCTHLPPGPYYYPPDQITDQPERFIMGELIREQILLLTREEIPHAVAVTIDQVEEQAKLTKIMATIHVERSSQKGIIIGKQGQMLKQIGTAARLQIQKLILGSVHLEIFVKVQPKWRSSRFQLADLGYRLEN